MGVLPFHIFMLMMCMLAISVHAQTFLLGRCPKPAVQANFRVEQYLGKWFEIERTNFIVFEVGLKCVTANYSLLDNGHIKVANQGVSIKTGSKSKPAIGDAYAPDASQPAKLSVGFIGGFIGDWFRGPYWVLNTDYVNYSVVFSCRDFVFARTETVWILGRSQTLPNSTLATLQYGLTSAGIQVSTLVKAVQDCDPSQL